MRILLTNDDGIHAPGLKSLEKIARAISDDVWIVAPETDQSGASHSLTLNDPLRLRMVSDRHYAVKGTPTDCVIMALRYLMKGGEKPDLVLSGVNRGQNIADDTTYSGTVAGAMEAALLGYRAIALSQAYGFGTTRNSIRWHTAETLGPGIVRALVDLPFPKDSLINVNFPDCEPGDAAGAEVTRQGKRDQDTLAVDERLDGRENPYFWLTFKKKDQELVEGTDIAALTANRVSITPVSLDLTHESFLVDLKSRSFEIG
ncbi:MAG: 5'/3'-nucleotidase SurE [Rhodobiaceae bacterium]|nr:5'/3'-nucleotidase SurE [Rhodobiaceae bacterium]